MGTSQSGNLDQLGQFNIPSLSCNGACPQLGHATTFSSCDNSLFSLNVANSSLQAIYISCINNSRVQVYALPKLDTTKA